MVLIVCAHGDGQFAVFVHPKLQVRDSNGPPPGPDGTGISGMIAGSVGAGTTGIAPDNVTDGTGGEGAGGTTAGKAGPT